ncbi:Rhs-family protein [Minicystis rosea]|nr:Rhs-family protein [Minicystis rosea]
MSESRHIADAEAEFQVVNVTPDFCKVNGKRVAFDIFRDLTPQRVNYAKKVRARGVPVLTVDSVVAGVVGNMGEGVFSGVSKSSGDVIVVQGVENVRAERRYVCRDQDICLMNVKVG